MAGACDAYITNDRGSRTNIAHAATFEAAKAIARRFAEQGRLRLVPTGDGRYLVSNYPRRWRGFGDVELWIEGEEPDDDEPGEAL